MEAVHSATRLQRIFEKGRIGLLSLGFTLLLVASLVAGGAHHHLDLQDHADCPICTFAQHTPAEAGVESLLPDRLPASQALIIIPVLAAVIIRRTTSLGSRAPPF